jgi:hypothetical protein
MKNIKCLITAGCSYSQVPNRDTTWRVHLNEWLNPEKVYYLGQGAAGNGIISRKVVHALTEALETYKPEEILVGVMWSGHNRREIYSKNRLDTTIIEYGTEVYQNPVKIVDKHNYHIVNVHWNDNLTTNFVKHAYIREDSLMITLEHVLRIQWLLKLNNVKYFMTEYDYDTFDSAPFKKELLNSDKDLTFLYNQIDRSQWLPINNMYEYAKEKSGFKHARPPDPHPSTEQHKAMVEKVLIPFLLENKLVYDILT